MESRAGSRRAGQQPVPDEPRGRREYPPVVVAEQRHDAAAVSLVQRDLPQGPEAPHLGRQSFQRQAGDRLAGSEPGEPFDERAHPRVVERELAGGQVAGRAPRAPGGKRDGFQTLAVRPRQIPGLAAPVGGAAVRAEVVDDHGFDPVRQGVRPQAPRRSRIERFGAPVDRGALADRLTLPSYLAHHGIDPGAQTVRADDRLDVEIVEHLSGLRRIEDVFGLVDAKFRQDDRQLLLQHLADAVLDRIPDHEVDGPHGVGLADAVDAADPLLQLHRIPGNVVVDHHVAELQVQTFAAGVGRHQEAGRAGERLLRLRALLQSHRSVETDHRESPVGQKFAQHLLRGDELGEDQDLQIGVALLLLQPIDPAEQGFRLGIGAGALRPPGRFEEQRHLRAFVLEGAQPAGEQRIDLLLAVEVGPFLVGQLGKQQELIARRGQRFEAAFQGDADRAGRGGDQPLHQDHQEAEVSLVFPQRPVVAVAHVFGHRLVERALAGVPLIVGDRFEAGMARLEQWLSVGVDRAPLLGADHERPDPFAGDGAGVGERGRVDQRQQPMERVGLALMRGRGEQEQTGRGLRQPAAKLIAGDLIGAAAQAMRLVDDDQVPAGGGQVLEPVAVVLGHPFPRPPAAAVERLDRIQRAHDLIAGSPDVVRRRDAAEGGEVARQEGAKLLGEVGAQLRHPLVDEPLGGHHQGPSDDAAQLELAHDEPGLDRLAESDFVRQQIADAVARRRPRQRTDLVRQRDDRRLDRRQQRILRQRAGDPRRGRRVGQPRAPRDGRLRERTELVRPNPDERLGSRQPDPALRRSPQVLRLDHPANLPVRGAPRPITGLQHRLVSRS